MLKFFRRIMDVFKYIKRILLYVMSLSLFVYITLICNPSLFITIIYLLRPFFIVFSEISTHGIYGLCSMLYINFSDFLYMSMFHFDGVQGVYPVDKINMNVLFMKISEMLNPASGFDPYNQAPRGYIPGGNNEPLLGNIIAEIERQEEQLYTKVRPKVFTMDEKRFIRGCIEYISPESEYTKRILAGNPTIIALSRVHPSGLLKALKGIE